MKGSILNEPVQPMDAIGYPSREPDLDVLPGFQNPPRGYGQIPFYWWVGDKLDKDRLVWQLDKLKEKGICGLQINYPHFASMPETGEEGWPTCPGEPEVFSKDWWELWNWYVEEVKKRDMAVGLSDYTIHWEKSHYYMDEVAKTPGVRGTKLNFNKILLTAGEEYNAINENDFISVTAYKINNGQVQSGTGIELSPFIVENGLNWKAPDGEWEIISIWGTPTELDPMNPIVGNAIAEHYLKPFEDRNPGELGKTLNYFFQDEERMRGEEGFPWNADFAEYFKSKKGYDIIPYLPALFEDIGDISPKIRLDYHDVKSELIGNGYFKPIFEWSWSHGMIFGADNNGRGIDPACYGDYFRTQRFITAPGNDTPGRNSDLIKEKVNSSIAHLYQRPRVWLEGYHSSGWGTTLESITVPTSENFVFGANLLNLHGLYYSTHGGWWEWAPPDFHFRMPYWDHEGAWLKYYERLSYLMSQGHHRCDVAIMYPVSALEASLYIKDEKGNVTNAGTKSVDVAFDIGKKIAITGIDFDFIDFESVENSEVGNCKLKIAGEEYGVLILPAMQAIRKKTIERALEHYRAGGVVISTGILPSESDTVGKNDKELDEIIREIFGKTASEVQGLEEISKNVNSNGGTGIYVPEGQNIPKLISETIQRDFIPLNELNSGYANHHKIGNRDVYMVRNVPKNSECFFKARGKVEIWNPWDGSTKPVYTFKPAEGGTIVRMPMESYQDNIIVFTPGQQGDYVEETNMDIVESILVNGNDTVVGYVTTEGEKYAKVSIGNKTSVFKGIAKLVQKIEIDGTWDFELKPTLDNQWGDFRLPAAREFIGAEARFFSYKEEKEPDEALYSREYDDSSWERVTYSRGTAFWQFTPAEGYDEDKFVCQINSEKVINSNTAINDGLSNVTAREYDYSIRWGITDSSMEEQNWHHGLNGIAPNEFLILAPDKDTYYWTTVYALEKVDGRILTSSIKPDKVWINGVLHPVDLNVKLSEGYNTILIKYSNTDKNTKRAYFIIEDASIDGTVVKYPLAIDWFVKPNIYKFDAFPQDKPRFGVYRFELPLGLSAMKITAYGNIEVWVDGERVQTVNTGKTVYGAGEYKVTVKTVSKNAVKVAIRIEHQKGFYQGAAIPEPIKLECTEGQIVPGDWSALGILESYSGGAWYRKNVLLPQIETGGKVILNLGKIAATAEVMVNDQTVGILVCPPWKLDISALARMGENTVEILVYNTLCNHYSTIPSRYNNFPKDAVSGLIGPVSIDIILPTMLKP